MLQCIHWNARSVTNKWSWLRQEYFQKAHIIAIQETFLNKHSTFFLKNYNIFRIDREDRPGGGVITAVKNNIPAIQLSIPNDPEGITECIGVQLTINSSKLNIFNFYKPHGALNYEWISNTIDNNSNNPCILVGDLNINILNYSHPHTQTFLEWLNNKELHLLNTTESTRTKNESHSSLLDISICTTDLWRFTTCDIHPDSFDSDHHPVSITSTYYQLKVGNPRIRHITKWMQASCEINQNSMKDIQNFEDFNDICNQAIKNNSFSYAEKDLSRFPPYWDWECSKMLAHKRKSARLAKQLISSQLWSEHKRIGAKLKKMIQQKSSKYWNDTCQKACKDNNIYKIIRNLKNRNKEPNDIIFCKHGNNITDRKEQTEEFLKIFTDNPSHPGIPYTLYGTNHHINTSITMPELTLAIKQMRNTAPGEDGIKSDIYKHLNVETKTHVLRIFNDIFTSGEIPPSWTKAIILPIKKPEKPKYDFHAYRPIALTAVSAKLFERILLHRIMNYLIQNKKLHPNHYGYVPFRDSQSLLCELHRDISNGRKSKSFILAATLDIKSAYNNVWTDGLIYKCMNIGLGGNMGKWLVNFLSHRKVQVKWRGCLSRTSILTAGIPQGSVLSGILFTIFLADLFDAQHSNVTIKIFADDIFVYVIDKDIEKASRNLQITINNILKWCHYWHLPLCLDKCNIINFSRLKKIPKDIIIENTTMKWSMKIKILGIWFNRKFNFTTHLNHIKSKAETQINLMRSISNYSWGITTHHAIQIANATIRSLFEYGCPCFQSMTKSEQHTIDMIYNKALRVATGLPITTPIPILRKVSNQGNVHVRIKHLAKKFIIKNISNLNISSLGNNLMHSNNQNNHNIMRSLLQFFAQEDISIANILQAPWTDPNQSDHKYLIITEGLSFQTKSLHDKAIAQLWLEYQHNVICNSILIATDASKDINKTSIAIYNYNTHHGIAQIIDHHNCIFTAESMALELAIKHYIKEKGSYYIITDSLSSLKALENLNRKSPGISKRIHDALINVTPTDCHITLIWVPGHTRIEPNSIADHLAREGPFITNSYHKIDAQDLYTLMNKNQDMENEYEWLNSDYSETFDYLHNIDYTNLNNIKMNRKWEVSLLKWRTKQIATNSYLCKIQQRENPLCDSCMIPETVEHILLECSNYTLHREKLFSTLNSHPSTYNDIMMDIHRNKTNVKAFIKFLQDVDRDW